MNKKEQQIIEAMLTGFAFYTLNINEMTLADQLAYTIAMLRIAELTAPFVEKYGDSVDDLEKRLKEKADRQRAEDFVEIIKALNEKKEQ